MPLDQLKNNTKEIQDQLQNVIESNVAYYKLWFFKVTVKSVTVLLKMFLLTLFFMMVLLFVSVAIGFALSSLFNSYVLGFLAVAGIYFILMLIVYFIKDKIVEGSILEKFSEVFFNED